MRVSTCRKEITPNDYFPCYLSGHAIRTGKAVGIMDSLWSTALVLDVDGTKMIWITIELILLEREFTDSLRNDLYLKYNVNKNLIYINFVHTHSAPECRQENFFGGPGAVDGYMNFVKEQTLLAVQSCFEKEFIEVKAYANTTIIEGCYGNRNGLDKPCDKEVITIEFRQENNVIAGFCNFANHSTVLGPQNLEVSNDLAGYVARFCEKKWGVYPIIVIGAAGDMSNRLYRQGNDKKELERVGKEMMNQVFTHYFPKELKLHKPIVTPWSFNQTFIPNKKDKIKQFKDIQSKIENAKTFDEKKVYTSALGIAKKGLTCKPFILDMECYYVDMGDFRFFVIPCELFSRFGITIKKAMNAPCSVLWGYCNYSIGYLGNIEDYGNSFETAASDIPSGTTEKIVHEIVNMIQKINKKEN